MRRSVLVAIVAAGCLAASASLGADVKSQERTQIKFEGMLGRMFGLFGGKAAKEGIVSSVAVKGDRKATLNESTGQIIDLAEEKIYDLDVKKKTYTVMTFAEYRRQIEEAQKKAAEDAARAEPREKGEAPEFEVDFDAKATGEARAINGFDCRQTVVTVTVRQKGKTLDEAGGIVMTADTWLAPKIAALNESAAFDLRFLKKLGIDFAGAAEQMAAALAMFPGLGQAQEKFRAEKGSLDGTAILTTVKFESVRSAAQAAETGKQEERPSGGIGGMLGGLGRKIGKKKDEQPATAGSGRSTIMTSTTEVLSVAASAEAGDVAVPAGFRQK